MADKPQPLGRGSGQPRDPKQRIETQIHRRKKAKKVLPLEAEWDAEEGTPPKRLRMPPENMNRTPRPK